MKLLALMPILALATPLVEAASERLSATVEVALITKFGNLEVFENRQMTGSSNDPSAGCSLSQESIDENFVCVGKHRFDYTTGDGTPKTFGVNQWDSGRLNVKAKKCSLSLLHKPADGATKFELSVDTDIMYYVSGGVANEFSVVCE